MSTKKHLTLSATEQEIDLLKQLAQKHNQSLSNYMISCTLNQTEYLSQEQIHNIYSYLNSEFALLKEIKFQANLISHAQVKKVKQDQLIDISKELNKLYIMCYKNNSNAYNLLSNLLINSKPYRDD